MPISQTLGVRNTRKFLESVEGVYRAILEDSTGDIELPDDVPMPLSARLNRTYVVQNVPRVTAVAQDTICNMVADYIQDIRIAEWKEGVLASGYTEEELEAWMRGTPMRRKAIDESGSEYVRLPIPRAPSRRNYFFRDMDWTLDQYREPNQPRLSKRISKYVYDVDGVRLSSNQVSLIGNYLNTLGGDLVEYKVVFTNEYMWKAGTFGQDDEESCFFTSNWASVPTIMMNGGYAVMIFRNDKPYIRAWGYTLGDAMMLFNAYQNTDERGFFRTNAPIDEASAIVANILRDGAVKSLDAYVNNVFMNNDRCRVVGEIPAFRSINLEWKRYMWKGWHGSLTVSGRLYIPGSDGIHYVDPDGGVYVYDEDIEELYHCAITGRYCRWDDLITITYINDDGETVESSVSPALVSQIERRLRRRGG